MKTTIAPLDPEAAAHQEAAAIRNDPEAYLYGSLDRVIADSPFLDREAVLSGVEAFHQERMKRIPSAATYPEARPWVEHALDVDRRLKELLGLSDREMALYRSLGAYLTFRGFRKFGKQLAGLAPRAVEKCRVAFVPDTDRGAVHIKNIDDPPNHWKRKREPITAFPDQPLTWDGTGSGLHIDEEPEQIFPLPITRMCIGTCGDVPAAVQFLTRYSPFWGKCNIVLFDMQRRSVAIEKCSHNHMQVHAADSHGRSHCSGMACRDAASPIAKYQKARRDEYCRLFGLTDENASDLAFWSRCDVAEKKLAEFLHGQEKIVADELVRLFITPRSEGGLNKTGDRYHPRQALLEYTLVTHAFFHDERSVVRWQREPGTCAWPAEPERYQF